MNLPRNVRLPVVAAALALLSLLLVPTFLAPDPTAAPGLGDIARDEPRLREFLRTHPGHAEASLLLAESILASPSAPVAALDEAWTLASRSRTLRLGIARLLLERGHLREGVDRHRELLRERPDPDQALALASTLLDLAAQDPAREEELRRDAVSFLEDYFRDASASARQTGALDLARLLWRLGRHEEMLTVLSTAAGRFPLERGKALARLGRRAEAHAALDEAEEVLARDAAGRDQARLFKAELYLAAGAPQGAEILESLIRDRSPLAPVAHLLRGRLSDFRIGLAALTGPALLHETGFDLARVRAALGQADPKEAVPVAREIVRLFPRSRAALTDLARLLLRAGHPAEAAERHLEAGDVREAAAACFEGGLHLRAAALFRRASDPFGEAGSLRLAGLTGDALDAYARFASTARRDDPRLAEALIQRGRMLAGAGRRDEALAEFDRVVRAEEVDTDPRKPEWCEALLERGLVLLEIAGREAEGKKSLDELFERTAGDPARRPLAIRAAFELARRAVAERDWTGALGRLRAVERLGEHREARFLLGDVLLVRGEYEEAARVFGGAVDAYAGAEDRLRGLLGRARALARLGRKDEAKRDLERGRALHAGARGGFDRTIAAYWASALDSLGSELQ